jgi:hypothetical protein
MKKGIFGKAVIASLLVGLGVGGWFYDKQQKEEKIAKEKHDTPHWEVVSTSAEATISAYFPPTIITYSDLIKKDVYARKVWVKLIHTKEGARVQYIKNSIVILCDENSFKTEEMLAYSSSDELLFKLPAEDKFETPVPKSNMDYVVKDTCAY